MKKHLLKRLIFAFILLFTSFLTGNIAFAQLNYTFTSSQEAYVAIVGTPVAGVPAANADDAFLPSIPIPFTFVYNGTNYTDITPSTNGIIYMGSVTGTTPAYSNSPTAISTFLGNTVNGYMPTLDALFPMAGDLAFGTTGLGASVSTDLQGTAPDRTFIVQFSNYIRLGSAVGGAMNMQVVFHETTNAIDYKYGTWLGTSSPYLLGVGIRSATDIFTLGNSVITTGTDTTEWTNARRNATNAAALTYNATVFPDSGLVYTFTPVPPSSNADISVNGLDAPTSTFICDSSEIYVPIYVSNTGLASISNSTYTVNLIETSTGNVIQTLNITNPNTLTTNQRDTLVVGPLLPTRIQSYTIQVISTNNDGITANDTATSTFAVARNCRRLSYDLTRNETGTYDPLTGGTVLNTAESNDGVFPVTLPNPFWYNGRFFNSINVSSNGFASFGPISATATNPLGLANSISPFGNDLTAPANGISYGTRGNSFVIQFQGMYQSTVTGQDSANFNFQIILNADYSIQFAFGGMTYTGTAFPAATGHVGLLGLTGAVDSTFYTLSNLPYDFTFTNLVPSYASNIGAVIIEGVPIPSGYTMTWVPTNFSSIDLGVSGIVEADASLCSGTTVNPRVVLTNQGLSAIISSSISVSLTDNSGTSVVRTINYSPASALLSGVSDTVSLGAITYNLTGSNTISVRATTANDNNGNNNSFSVTNSVIVSTPIIYTDTLVCVGSRKVVKIPNAGSVSFYSDMNMSNLLGTDSLVYPSFNNSTSVYAVPSTSDLPIYGGLAAAPAALTSTILTNYGLVIRALRNTSIASANVYPTSAGTITVNLVDSASSAVLATTNYTVNAAALNQAQNVNFTNFNMTAGTTYLLRIATMTASLHRDNPVSNNNGASFPITVGDRAIISTGWSGAVINAYYWFYNIKFGSGTPCLQPRVINLEAGAVPSAPPVITASGGTTLCPGDTVTLTAPNAAYYLWSNNATTQSIRVFRNGTFSVRTILPGGCLSTASASIRFTVGTAPGRRTITASGPTSICGSGTVTLTSNGTNANHFLWSTGDTTRAITVNASGSYTVQMKNTLAGCYSLPSLPTVVNLGPAPNARTISASGSTTICPGDSVILSPDSNAFYYLWSNGATTRNIKVRQAGSYSLIVGTSSTCISPASNAIDITLNTAPNTPTVSLSGSTVLCGAGGTVVLTSSALSNNVWSNGATTQSITVSAAGTYSVREVNSGAGSCSSSFASTPVVITLGTVPTTPTITATGSTTVCQTTGVVLTAPIAAQYLWSNGATTRTITATESGSYTAQVINASGCTSAVSNSIAVTVFPALNARTISASGATAFCPGDSVVLSSDTVTPFYLWSNGATTPTITVRLGGTYTLRVGSLSNCLSTPSNAIVTTLNAAPATPTITVTSGSLAFCDGVGSVVLTSSAVSNNLWSTGDTTRSITVNALGSYTVRAISTSGGCSSLPSLPKVTSTSALPTTPVITNTGGTTICQGTSITLTAPTATRYIWNTGATTRAITVNTEGSYSVQVINASGCTSLVSSDVAITVLPQPTRVSISAVGNPTFCTGLSVLLRAPAGQISYQWYRGTSPVGITDTLRATIAGVYYVRVGNGICLSPNSDSIRVAVLAAPTAPTITVAGGATTTICEGSSIQLVASTGAAGYLWNTGDTGRILTVTTAGNYSVSGINAAGCYGPSSFTVPVTSRPRAITPVIEENGDSIVARGGVAGYAYAWYKNGVQIPGAIAKFILKSSFTGNNRFTVRARIGVCYSDTSNAITITSIAQSRAADLHTYPTPTDKSIHINMDQVTGKYAVVRITDGIGKEVLHKVIEIDSAINAEIDLSSLPAGMYQLMLNAENVSVVKSVIKN